jgi:hypothetical protein
LQAFCHGETSTPSQQLQISAILSLGTYTIPEKYYTTHVSTALFTNNCTYEGNKKQVKNKYNIKIELCKL